MNQASQHLVASPPTTDVRWPQPGVAQVVIAGEHDLSTWPDLDETLSETLGGCSKLIVDLQDAKYIDSSTIRALVSAKDQADARGRTFNLLVGHTQIENVLQVTGVLPILNRVRTLDDALSGPVESERNGSPGANS